jgi:beta-lactamase superfamily II metal-dependent hydrolase
MFDKPQFIFWPVGTGDSTTIVIKDGVVLQVDLRDLSKSDDAGDDHISLVDKLVEELPEKDGNPYLAGFALTHPDKDHILGFADLLDRVTIGELWFTPRVFIENDTDLCDDAVAFKDEAERRVKATIDQGGAVISGDKVRVIGYDLLLQGDEFEGFPDEKLTVPGNSITELDGEDYEGEFNAFIHAPFKDEDIGDRNNTSLAMQVVLGSDPSAGGVLLFGDIAYPRIRKIFDFTKEAGNEQYLAWKVFLAPHHCSKSAMYQDEDGSLVLKQDILEDLAKFQIDDGYIVASSEAIPAQNKKGDNPPHAKAKMLYQEVANGQFLCTHEDSADSEPLIFVVDDGDITFVGEAAAGAVSIDKIALAVATSRGSDEPPSEKVGFGQ